MPIDNRADDINAWTDVMSLAEWEDSTIAEAGGIYTALAKAAVERDLTGELDDWVYLFAEGLTHHLNVEEWFLGIRVVEGRIYSIDNTGTPGLGSSSSSSGGADGLDYYVSGVTSEGAYGYSTKRTFTYTVVPVPVGDLLESSSSSLNESHSWSDEETEFTNIRVNTDTGEILADFVNFPITDFDVSTYWLDFSSDSFHIFEDFIKDEGTYSLIRAEHDKDSPVVIASYDIDELLLPDANSYDAKTTYNIIHEPNFVKLDLPGIYYDNSIYKAFYNSFEDLRLKYHNTQPDLTHVDDIPYGDQGDQIAGRLRNLYLQLRNLRFIDFDSRYSAPSPRFTTSNHYSGFSTTDYLAQGDTTNMTTSIYGDCYFTFNLTIHTSYSKNFGRISVTTEQTELPGDSLSDAQVDIVIKDAGIEVFRWTVAQESPMPVIIERIANQSRITIDGNQTHWFVDTKPISIQLDTVETNYTTDSFTPSIGENFRNIADTGLTEIDLRYNWDAVAGEKWEPRSTLSTTKAADQYVRTPVLPHGGTVKITRIIYDSTTKADGQSMKRFVTREDVEVGVPAGDYYEEVIQDKSEVDVWAENKYYFRKVVILEAIELNKPQFPTDANALNYKSYVFDSHDFKRDEAKALPLYQIANYLNYDVLFYQDGDSNNAKVDIEDDGNGNYFVYSTGSNSSAYGNTLDQANEFYEGYFSYNVRCPINNRSETVQVFIDNFERGYEGNLNFSLHGQRTYVPNGSTFNLVAHCECDLYDHEFYSWSSTFLTSDSSPYEKVTGYMLRGGDPVEAFGGTPNLEIILRTQGDMKIFIYGCDGERTLSWAGPLIQEHWLRDKYNNYHFYETTVSDITGVDIGRGYKYDSNSNFTRYVRNEDMYFNSPSGTIFKDFYDWYNDLLMNTYTLEATQVDVTWTGTSKTWTDNGSGTVKLYGGGGSYISVAAFIKRSDGEENTRFSRNACDPAGPNPNENRITKINQEYTYSAEALGLAWLNYGDASFSTGGGAQEYWWRGAEYGITDRNTFFQGKKASTANLPDHCWEFDHQVMPNLNLLPHDHTQKPLGDWYYRRRRNQNSTSYTYYGYTYTFYSRSTAITEAENTWFKDYKKVVNDYRFCSFGSCFSGVNTTTSGTNQNIFGNLFGATFGFNNISEYGTVDITIGGKVAFPAETLIYTHRRMPDKDSQYIPTGITTTTFTPTLPEEQSNFEYIGKIQIQPPTASKRGIKIEQLTTSQEQLWLTPNPAVGTSHPFAGVIHNKSQTTSTTTPNLIITYYRHNRHVPGNPDPNVNGEDIITVPLSVTRTVEPPFPSNDLQPKGLIFWRLLEEYDGPVLEESSSSSSEDDESSSSSEAGPIKNIFGYDVPENTAFLVTDENTSDIEFKLGDHASNGIRLRSNLLQWNLPFYGENQDPGGGYLVDEIHYNDDFSVYLKFYEAVQNDLGDWVLGNLYEVSVGALRENYEPQP